MVSPAVSGAVGVLTHSQESQRQRASVPARLEPRAALSLVDRRSYKYTLKVYTAILLLYYLYYISTIILFLYCIYRVPCLQIVQYTEYGVPKARVLLRMLAGEFHAFDGMCHRSGDSEREWGGGPDLFSHFFVVPLLACFLL